MQELLAWRGEFPILSTSTYLISNSLGAMPRMAEAGLLEYAAAWRSEGVRAWQKWWDLSREVGDLIAPLIGAGPNTVSCHLNVTSAEATIASCFDYSGKRNKIVYTAMNFPSVSYLYKEQERLGARVVTVPTRDDIGVDLDELLDAIDEETLLVPISHVLFRSAFIQDAAAIAGHCKRVGAHLVLDTYQSTGVVPVDVESWGVDFAVGGTLKWLCGGPGVAFLYVNPEVSQSMKPKLTGWVADARPFEFVVNDHELMDGSYRFMNGTPNVPGLYAARAGLEIVNKIGTSAIRENSRRQTAMMLDMAGARGWKTTAPTNADQRGGTVAFGFEDGYAVAQELIERGVLVDYRPKAGVRASPHFYNTDEEIIRLFTEAEDILNTGAHLRHRERRTLVT